MKVKDLKKILEQHPDNMRVCVDGYEGGYDDINHVGKTNIAINVYSEGEDDTWWEGRHQGEDDHSVEPEHKIETALILSRHV